MKKLIFLLALTALFASCSKDEPEAPTGKYISDNEFRQTVINKTWKFKDARLLDSEGHDLKEPLADIMSIIPQGYLFSDSNVRCAIGNFWDTPRYSFVANWQYDEKSGRLYIFSLNLNPDDYCEVESADNFEIVFLAKYGSLAQGQWGQNFDEEHIPVRSWNDESYVRLTYNLFASDFDPDQYFWRLYPEKQ